MTGLVLLSEETYESLFTLSAHTEERPGEQTARRATLSRKRIVTRN